MAARVSRAVNATWRSPTASAGQMSWAKLLQRADPEGLPKQRRAPLEELHQPEDQEQPDPERGRGQPDRW